MENRESQSARDSDKPALTIPVSPLPIPMHLALFDFDHTVTTADTYSRFLRRVTTPPQLARAKWSVGPWLAGYRLGLVSAQAIRRRSAGGSRGSCSPAGPQTREIPAHARAYAHEALPTLLLPQMMQRVA